MTDFKLKLYNLSPDTDAEQVAADVVDNYGDAYDAPDEFSASVVGGNVEVVARNVAKGDMRVLREDIYRDFGDEDDSMMIVASSGDAARGSLFSTDLDDDDE